MLRVYVSVRLLPDDCFPAFVRRRGPRTLLIVDPRSSREEATLWCLDNLTATERDYCTVAYGQTPGDVEPEFFDGQCLQWVPEPLRLPWEPAWQGERVSA